MTADELRAVQAPWKDRYRSDPGSAILLLRATGRLDVGRIHCRLPAGGPEVVAGLHPAVGGSPDDACAGQMLLEALVACAGVTLGAVATALGLAIDGGTVRAEGEVDLRGTLGIDRSVPVGFTAIRLAFDLITAEPEERLGKLVELTERYCLVYQTLAAGAKLQTTVATTAP